MAALSGFLKRQRPQIRDAIGPVKRWLAQHSRVFELAKHGGTWMVLLNPAHPAPGETAAARSAPIADEVVLGVEDWI